MKSWVRVMTVNVKQRSKKLKRDFGDFLYSSVLVSSAAISEYYRLDGLNNRNFFSHSSGG